MREALARFEEGGAAGLVLVVDLPEDEIPGAYLLYDGVHRDIPAVFVGREAGRRLREALPHGGQVRLTLEAVVEDAVTHNVVGLVPGASDELVVLQSHTDGPNGLEDNGPEAIVAMAAHLARLPHRRTAPRRPGRSSPPATSPSRRPGASRHSSPPTPTTWCRASPPRVSLEHLGALARPEDYAGTGLISTYEFGCLLRHPAPGGHRRSPRRDGPGRGHRLDRAASVRPRHDRQLPRRHQLARRRLPVLAHRRAPDAQLHHRPRLHVQRRAGPAPHRRRGPAPPGHRLHRGRPRARRHPVGRAARTGGAGDEHDDRRVDAGRPHRHGPRRRWACWSAPSPSPHRSPPRPPCCCPPASRRSHPTTRSACWPYSPP